jgi:hypothetical protein
MLPEIRGDGLVVISLIGRLVASYLWPKPVRPPIGLVVPLESGTT